MKSTVEKTYRLAKSHEAKGEIEKARNLFERVLRVAPNDKRAKKALNRLNRLPRQNSALHPPQSSIDQLIKLLKSGEFDAVLKQANTLLSNYPKSFFIWNIHGAANKALGRLKLAERSFEKACSTNPKYAEAFNNLASTVLLQGKPEAAIQLYSKAVALKPTFFSAQHSLGALHLKFGDLDKAKTHLSLAVDLEPDNATAHNDFGVALKDLGEFQEAAASFSKAIEIDAANALHHLNLGTALYSMGKVESSVTCFKRAIVVSPSYSEAYNKLGMSLKKLGRIDEAVVSFMTALEHDPQFRSAMLNLSKLPTGSLNSKDLQTLLELASRSAPDLTDSNQQFFAANMLRHQGKISESFELLKEANASELDRSEIQNWQREIREISEEVARWEPAKIQTNLRDRVKPLFILGPSRSGKSTIERMLSPCKEVSLGFEAWKGSQAVKDLRNFSSDGNGAFQETTEAKFETLFFKTESEIKADGKRFHICTNPTIINVAHLIFDAFENAHFLFVQRDSIENAAEFFATEYRSKHYHASYDANASLEYVLWYNSLTAVLGSKMGSRAKTIRFEDLIADPGTHEAQIADWLGIDFEVSSDFSANLQKRKAGDYSHHYKNLLTSEN